MNQKRWHDLMEGKYVENYGMNPPDYVLPALEAHGDLISEWVYNPELELQILAVPHLDHWTPMAPGSVTFNPKAQYRLR